VTPWPRISNADFEDRRFGAHEAAHVKDRAQLMRTHDAERNDGMGVAVHDRRHVRADAIDFAMDEAFEVDRPAAGVERIAVEVAGTMLRASRKRSRRSSWRMLTCPKASTTCWS
jgi:hypothetical protein